MAIEGILGVKRVKTHTIPGYFFSGTVRNRLRTPPSDDGRVCQLVLPGSLVSDSELLVKLGSLAATGVNSVAPVNSTGELDWTPLVNVWPVVLGVSSDSTSGGEAPLRSLIAGPILDVCLTGGMANLSAIRSARIGG